MLCTVATSTSLPEFHSVPLVRFFAVLDFASQKTVFASHTLSLISFLLLRDYIRFAHIRPTQNPLEPQTKLRLVRVLIFLNFLFLLKNGERGIRTLGEVAPTQIFEICTLNRSDISPFIFHSNLTKLFFQLTHNIIINFSLFLVSCIIIPVY